MLYGSLRFSACRPYPGRHSDRIRRKNVEMISESRYFLDVFTKNMVERSGKSELKSGFQASEGVGGGRESPKTGGFPGRKGPKVL